MHILLFLKKKTKLYLWYLFGQEAERTESLAVTMCSVAVNKEEAAKVLGMGDWRGSE